MIDRTVDVHIAKLRQKIPFLVKAIETVKDVRKESYPNNLNILHPVFRAIFDRSSIAKSST